MGPQYPHDRLFPKNLLRIFPFLHCDKLHFYSHSETDFDFDCCSLGVTRNDSQTAPLWTVQSMPSPDDALTNTLLNKTTYQHFS